MRHTKIVSTLGPASDSDSTIDALIAGGTDVFRLNFSHGTHESHAATLARVRAASARARRQVAVLQDLGGPKIRTGLLEDHRPLQLYAGDRLCIATGDFTGGPGRISTTFAGLAPSVRPGSCLLLADGLLELRVDSTDGSEIQTTVVEGGQLGERKGINAPGVPLPTSAITAKDVNDLAFGLSIGVDIVALSFVQTAADLRQARQLMIEHGGADIPLVAKLERPQALEHLGEIVDSCEAVMVARGDLGLEMPLEQVPRAQRDIIQQARRKGIPVILATQVLESMTHDSRPTRAEVSDAANAVYDGVDAIMLSGETAAGAFPARAVQTLDAIIRDAESSLRVDLPVPQRRSADDRGHDHAGALCAAAVTLADRGDAQAIVAVTRGGSTARRLSTFRPQAPILAAASDAATARRLALHWGVVPICLDLGNPVDLTGAIIGRQLLDRGLISSGASVVSVNIDPDLTRADANYLRLRRL
jgi:pyruvate kinase